MSQNSSRHSTRMQQKEENEDIWKLDSEALRKKLLNMSKPKLIKLCKYKKVSTNGNKAEMIERIIRKHNKSKTKKSKKSNKSSTNKKTRNRSKTMTPIKRKRVKKSTDNKPSHNEKRRTLTISNLKDINKPKKEKKTKTTPETQSIPYFNEEQLPVNSKDDSEHNSSPGSKQKEEIFTHKILTLKLCIEDLTIKNKQITIKNPSSDDRDKNLSSLLSKITKKFKFLSNMMKSEWAISIKDTIIDKSNPEQYHQILSSVPPIPTIEIIPKVRSLRDNIFHIDI